MQHLKSHLWFDDEASEAVNFYLSVFEDAEILNEMVYEDTPSGDALSIVPFVVISAATPPGRS